MKQVLVIAQIIIALLLAGSILLQGGGAGLGQAFGGGGEMYRSRRGLEKAVLFAAVILAVVFLIVSLINLIV